MEGTVKWYNIRNGYGFISGEDGKDYFVHHTQVPEDVKLYEETKVTFEPAETEKGPQARNLQVVDGAPTAKPVKKEEAKAAPAEEEDGDFDDEPADDGSDDTSDAGTDDEEQE